MILVVLAHARIPYFQGGYIGVDVFFVISGYVITGLLVREGDGGVGHKLRTFYTRRIRRIMPAASLTLIATLAATYHWLGPISGQSTGRDERWASLFGANWRFISVRTNYLQSLQPPSVILHFWSLAVEEQFYVVFPVVVFTIWAFLPSRYRRPVLVGFLGLVIATSAFWSAYQTHIDPITAYYSPFTRFWELGLGALVAALPVTLRLPAPFVRAALGWSGLAAVIASAVIFNDKTAYPGVAVWLPVGATALILFTGLDRTGVGPELVLERRPATFIGDISYSLYLWHFPLLMIPMQFSVTGNVSLQSRVELILASAVLATISYYLVENPIRKSKWLGERTAVTLSVGVALVAAVWLATWTFPHFIHN